MISLREEYKRLQHQKKAKLKELNSVKKSPDFLKMTEHNVRASDKIEAEEKEEELQKMKEHYDQLKGVIKLPAMLKENDSLRRNIERLQASIAESQRVIQDGESCILEGRNNRSNIDILDYETTCSKFESLAKDIAELKRSKMSISKGADNPSDGVRDAATEILQNIYELSGALGVPVEKEVNDSYSAICNRVATRKPVAVKSRSPMVSHQQSAKKAVDQSSTNRHETVKRNTFVVNNRLAGVEGRHRSTLKSRQSIEADKDTKMSNASIKVDGDVVNVKSNRDEERSAMVKNESIVGIVDLDPAGKKLDSDVKVSPPEKTKTETQKQDKSQKIGQPKKDKEENPTDVSPRDAKPKTPDVTPKKSGRDNPPEQVKPAKPADYDSKDLYESTQGKPAKPPAQPKAVKTSPLASAANSAVCMLYSLQ